MDHEYQVIRIDGPQPVLLASLASFDLATAWKNGYQAGVPEANLVIEEYYEDPL